jgi:hypothetical protein
MSNLRGGSIDVMKTATERLIDQIEIVEGKK